MIGKFSLKHKTIEFSNLSNVKFDIVCAGTVGIFFWIEQKVFIEETFDKKI
jgi:hypothetical protein